MNRIREIRQATGIAVKELAAKVGISPQQIYMIEKGQSGTNVDTAMKISKALDATMDELFILGHEMGGSLTVDYLDSKLRDKLQPCANKITFSAFLTPREAIRLVSTLGEVEVKVEMAGVEVPPGYSECPETIETTTPEA